MDWSDQGIVLSTRRHGESAAILSLLTEAHGRHAGLVRGGASRRQRGVLQAGNRLAVTWRARLEDHLGTFTVELLNNPAALWLDEPDRLAAMATACAMLDATLPEREPCETIFNALSQLLDTLDEPGWAVRYVAWELNLLAELGFGLDLTSCAATGRNDELAYVSPRSGRAVSLSAGEPYRQKLLRLPGFMIGAEEATSGDLADGLVLTGYFLHRHLFAPHQRRLPDVRERLVTRLRRGQEGTGPT